jgi:hypothetical protein
MLEWKRRFALATWFGLLAFLGCRSGGSQQPTPSNASYTGERLRSDPSGAARTVVERARLDFEMAPGSTLGPRGTGDLTKRTGSSFPLRPTFNVDVTYEPSFFI